MNVRCELIKLACSRPDDVRAPFREVWTHAALREAVLKETGWEMSRTEVGRTLRDEDIRPHRVRYWLHSQDPKFSEKVGRICDLYRRPPEGATVLCIDEKTGMQALGRPRGMTIPSRLTDRRFEYEYRRNGTLNLFGAFEPATGKILGECSARRTAEDTLAFMEKVAERYSGRVIVIWDNLNTHKGDRWRAFNRKHRGRFEFVYTPFHASWMNQIEIWFGILHRRVLRYGIFNSTGELAERVLGFVDHWNEVEAHPFSWSFRLQPKSLGARRAS